MSFEFEAAVHNDSKICELANPLNIAALRRKGRRKRFDDLPEEDSLSFFVDCYFIKYLFTFKSEHS